MTKQDRFNEVEKYLATKGCKFAVAYDFENNTKRIFGVTLTKKGKFYRVNNSIVPTNWVSKINEFIPFE